VKRIVCAADRASTIVQHGIWDDIKMVTREVANSGGVIILLFEVFRNDVALDN
jgi:hypothetical protein